MENLTSVWRDASLISRTYINCKDVPSKQAGGPRIVVTFCGCPANMFFALLYQISFSRLHTRTVFQKYHQQFRSEHEGQQSECSFFFPSVSFSLLVCLRGEFIYQYLWHLFSLSSVLGEEERGEASVGRRKPVWSGFIVGRHVQAEDPVWRLSGRRLKPLR